MKKTILLLFLLQSLTLSAQTNVDSLINVLNSTKTVPAERLALCYNIYNTYVAYDLEKAFEYARKGLLLAEKENDKAMSSKFNAAFGRIYNTKLSNDTALVYWEKAVNLAGEVEDADLEASAYLGIGILYARQDKYPSALEYFRKALFIYTTDRQTWKFADFYLLSY